MPPRVNPMRGPLLSGPLGSAASLAALGRWLDGVRPVVVLGPVWLAETLAATTPVTFLDEPDDRRVLVRARRRADKAGKPLAIGIAGAELPLARASLGALVIENAAGLPADEAERWVEALAPCLRPGGRLIAVDATGSPEAAGARRRRVPLGGARRSHAGVAPRRRRAHGGHGARRPSSSTRGSGSDRATP